MVRRQALFERLSAARPGGVVLVCAPAGSGKSVLLRSWVDAEGLAERVAWVSVERGEGDAQRFWLSVIDASAGVVDAGDLVSRVSPSPSFRGEAVVERLLSDLASLEEPILLVIDDLHELKSPDAVRWLELFLARLPAQLLVILATREHPELGLHRLRLTGGLTELRGPDLRFSLGEARQLLGAAGIGLSEAGVAVMHERTEGWAAGLRLAAISLAEHPDPERFVAEFSGSERTVAGYLLAEVLERQPPEVRELLLRTSILERVNGRLADALAGGTGSEAILQSLEDANAFVVSLDVGRSWFRYHHLFADLLQLELRRNSPEIIDALHRAASQWHEQHGYAVEAIRHAQTAGDWAPATRLLADNYVDLVFDGRKATLRALLAAFPAGAPDADAELALAFATARLYDGLLEESAMRIAVAQRLTATVPDGRKRLFELRLASARLWLACQRGDLATAKQAMRSFEAQTAHELAHSHDHRASAP
jgi:LuxR family maltose regulon positive regulatory protein